MLFQNREGKKELTGLGIGCCGIGGIAGQWGILLILGMDPARTPAYMMIFWWLFFTGLIIWILENWTPGSRKKRVSFRNR